MRETVDGMDVIVDDDGVTAHSEIIAPAVADLPLTDVNGQIRVVKHLNCDSFQIGVAMGNTTAGEPEAVVMVQMSYGDGGLFHFMSINEAQQLVSALQTSINAINDGSARARFN